MKVRMKVGKLGDFLNLPARPPYGQSICVGDVLDVTDEIGLDLIRVGDAELKLDGPIGRPYQLSMPIQEFEALKAKIEGRQPKPAAEPPQPKTREERDRLLAKMHW